MRLMPLVITSAIACLGGTSFAGTESVQRVFDISGSLNLSVTGLPELTKFAILLGPMRDPCEITRDTSGDDYSPWDIDDLDDSTVVNPLFGSQGNSGENPLFEAASLRLGVANGGVERPGQNGQREFRMTTTFTMLWEHEGQILTAIGVGDLAWAWTGTQRFGDESFTAVLQSPIIMSWNSAGLAPTLPSITIAAGSTMTYTLVPAPGVGAIVGMAGIFATRRRR